MDFTSSLECSSLHYLLNPLFLYDSTKSSILLYCVTLVSWENGLKSPAVDLNPFMPLSEFDLAEKSGLTWRLKFFQYHPFSWKTFYWTCVMSCDICVCVCVFRCEGPAASIISEHLWQWSIWRVFVYVSTDMIFTVTSWSSVTAWSQAIHWPSRNLAASQWVFSEL